MFYNNLEYPLSDAGDEWRTLKKNQVSSLIIE